MLVELENLKKELEELKLDNHYQNNCVKEYTKSAIKQVCVLVKDGKPLTKIEERLLGAFDDLEDIGWYLKDSSIILNVWVKLGKIVGIEAIEEKLNHFRNVEKKEEKIQRLLDLKINKKINNEMPSAPIFYKRMKEMMDESIDNVIAQLKRNNRIDEMLFVFEKDLDKFGDLETSDYSFGDTEDRETIGDFFTQIREILEFNYTRGLLREKME